MLKQELSRSFRSLLMHRLRALLSTLGVLFGVVAVVAMLSIGEGAKRETLEQIEQLGMRNLIIRQNVLSPEQYIQAREHLSRGLSVEDAVILGEVLPNLQRHAPLKIVEASLTGVPKEMTPEILATTRAYGHIKGLSLAEGRFLCDQDVKGRNLVCVLGYQVAKNLGREGHVGKTMRIENVQYEIVGILNPTFWKESKNTSITARDLNRSLFIPLGTETSLPRQVSLKPDVLAEIILQIDFDQNITTTAQFAKQVMQRLHGGHDDYQIVVPRELLNQAQRTQQTFNFVLGSIAAISLLVGGIGIMNIMLATVSERTREIGIRRALGANKKHILKQFLLETLLLTLTGAFLGVLLGVLVSFAISYLAGWKTIVTFWSLLLSLSMSAAVGLCSGLYPAIKAAKMNPITALRHN